MRKFLLSTLAALTVSASLAGVAEAQYYGHPGPPVARVEVVPAAPGPGFFWRPGYWNWYGGRYVWVGGLYVRGRPGYGHWYGPHWGPRGWARGYWGR